MWNTAAAPVPIFEDEDEAALISEFVKMSALYPKHTAFEICDYIFKDLRDPTLRAHQAALTWFKELSITERIRQARLNGVDSDKPKLTKDQLQAKILTTTEDSNLTAQEKKVMIEGYMSYAENEGWRVKAVAKTVEDKRTHFPQIVYALSPHAA